MYGYEWTNEYGIFRLTIDAKIQKEIRPVFSDELDFFELDKYWDYPKDTQAPLLWAEGVRKYILNGKCVADIQGGAFYTKPNVVLESSKRLKLKPINIDRLYEVNKSLLLSLEHKAIDLIQEQYNRFVPNGYEFVCAFSGGKDSLVLLDLVSKALAPDSFYVVFSNTGMELSDTLCAIEAAKARWPQLRFEEAVCHLKPSDTWEEFGPPASKNRWCCAVHKSVPTILKLRELTGKFNAKAVVYDGVRAEESFRRSKYEEVSIGTKNISQINVSPIHKWNSAEIYCHLLKNELLLNKAYRKGLFRVGCMVCPMSSDWWDSLSGLIYPDEVKELRGKIEKYVANAKPEKERKKYIERGGWKTRSGGRDLPNGGNRVQETISKNEISFTMKTTTQDWFEVAKVLGVFTETNDNHGVQKIDGINYEYRTKIADDAFFISYSPFSKMDRFVISHLRSVANKVAYCKGCKACEVQCPTGAYTIQPNGKILIREAMCVHCGNCMSFIEKGCMIAKSLSVTNGGNGMDLKGMNCYQNFGLQQNFMEHFMEYGVDCFSRLELGNQQYASLKKWLEHSGIVTISPKDHSVALTDLGSKLISFGPYNPFTWSIVWANLVYNSIICKWYCLNAEIGATYELGDIVTLLGENYSPTTRKNAVSSLLATFRHSPIGSALQQGVQMDKGYLRAGWEVPHAVSLLYSLYLYAEHTGKRSFTFSELINSHNNPDATGLSPSDVFGIDTKSFREQIQGLAISFPNYVRVSFISNLDNIILENYSSLDILDLSEE